MGIIYVAMNKISKKGYVGKTVYLLVDRRKQHEFRAINGGTAYFHNALRKYGFDAFEWKVIMEDEDEEELNQSERACIKLLKTKAPNGYNLTDGGDGVVGRRHTEEEKERISKTLKGRKKTPKHLARISKALMGRKCSDEHVQAMKNAVRPPQTPESNRKRSESLKGQRHTEESKLKISKSKKGKLSALRGKTYSEIYGDRAEEIREKRRQKRKVDKSIEAKQKRSEFGRKAALTRKADGTDGSIMVEFLGKLMSLRDWAEEIGVNYGTLWSRLNRGWSFEKALLTASGASRAEGQKKRRIRESAPVCGFKVLSGFEAKD